jgi:hypothetical protein
MTSNRLSPIATLQGAKIEKLETNADLLVRGPGEGRKAVPKQSNGLIGWKCRSARPWPTPQPALREQRREKEGTSALAPLTTHLTPLEVEVRLTDLCANLIIG